MALLVLEEVGEMVPELELGPAAPAVHQAGVTIGMALLQIYGAALVTQAVDAWETTPGGAESQQPMLPQHPTPAEPRDGDRQLLEDRKSTRLNSSHRCISYALLRLNKESIIARDD